MQEPFEANVHLANNFKKYITDLHERDNQIIQMMDRFIEAQTKMEKGEIVQKWRDKLCKILHNDFESLPMRAQVHKLLIAFTREVPLNLNDPISLGEIEPAQAFFLSSGHQFHLSHLVTFFIDSNRIINLFCPYASLHPLDILHLLNEIEVLNIAYDKEKFLPIVFETFFKFFKENNFVYLKWIIPQLLPNSIFRKEICSFFLCHIAQTTEMEMPLFEFIYNQANLSVDHLHLWCKEPDAEFNRGPCGEHIDNFSQQPPKRLLNIAALQGNFKVVEFMLNKGAALDTYLVSKEQRSALLDVVHGEKVHHGNPISAAGFGKITELLLIYGANYSVKNQDCTALDYATVTLVGFNGPEWPFYIFSGSQNQDPYSKECLKAIHSFIELKNQSKEQRIQNGLVHLIWEQGKTVVEGAMGNMGFNP